MPTNQSLVDKFLQTMKLTAASEVNNSGLDHSQVGTIVQYDQTQTKPYYVQMGDSTIQAHSSGAQYYVQDVVYVTQYGGTEEYVISGLQSRIEGVVTNATIMQDYDFLSGNLWSGSGLDLNTLKVLTTSIPKTEDNEEFIGGNALLMTFNLNGNISGATDPLVTVTIDGSANTFTIDDVQGVLTNVNNEPQVFVVKLDKKPTTVQIELLSSVQITNFKVFVAREAYKEKTNSLVIAPIDKYKFTVDDTATSTITLTAQLRKNGLVEELSDTSCYWFIEDPLVDSTEHENYSVYGGKGWRALNEIDETTKELQPESASLIVSFDEVQRSVVGFKCVATDANGARETSNTFKIINKAVPRLEIADYDSTQPFINVFLKIGETEISNEDYSNYSFSISGIDAYKEKLDDEDLPVFIAEAHSFKVDETKIGIFNTYTIEVKKNADLVDKQSIKIERQGLFGGNGSEALTLALDNDSDVFVKTRAGEVIGIGKTDESGDPIPLATINVTAYAGSKDVTFDEHSYITLGTVDGAMTASFIFDPDEDIAQLQITGINSGFAGSRGSVEIVWKNSNAEDAFVYATKKFTYNIITSNADYDLILSKTVVNTDGKKATDNLSTITVQKKLPDGAIENLEAPDGYIKVQVNGNDWKIKDDTQKWPAITLEQFQVKNAEGIVTGIQDVKIEIVSTDSSLSGLVWDTETIEAVHNGEKGDDGTSINIKGSVDSIDQLPSSGIQGDAYLVKGILYIWDPEKKKWVETDSLVPDATIGDNGNWFIDGTDTGKSSRGQPGKDGANIEYVYYRSQTEQTNLSAPKEEDIKAYPETITDTTGGEWYPSPLGINPVSKYEYVSIRIKPAGAEKWNSFSKPVIWARWGDKGIDGDGVEYKYYLKNDTTKPAYPGENWTDDPQGVSASNKYEYVAIIKTTYDNNNNPTESITVTLWNQFTQDGVSFSGVVEYYKAGTSATDAPEGVGTNNVPNSTWKTAIADAGHSETNKYLWNIEGIKSTDASGNETIKYTAPDMIQVWNGRTVETITGYYQISTGTTVPGGAPSLSNNGNTLNAGSWPTSILTTPDEATYLWEATVTKYKSADVNGHNTYEIIPAHIIGYNGRNGTDGKGVTIKGVAYVKVTLTDSHINNKFDLYSDEACTQQIIPTEDADAYLAQGYLFVYSGSNNQFTCVGKIQGPKGSDGNGVSNVVNYYMASSRSSGVSAGESGELADEQWDSSPQETTSEKPFLWNYEVVFYTDMDSKSTEPTIIGYYTEDGRGIQAIHERYCISASSTMTAPDPFPNPVDIPSTGAVANTWYKTSPLTTPTLKYLWNCEKIDYTDGTVNILEPALMGTHGEQGVSGTEYGLSIVRDNQVESWWITQGSSMSAISWRPDASAGDKWLKTSLRKGDFILITGTATDTGNAHEIIAVAENNYANTATSISATSITHSIAKAGDDGDSVATSVTTQYAYYLCNSATFPSSASKLPTTEKNETLNNGWSFSSQSVSDTQQYEYISERTKKETSVNGGTATITYGDWKPNPSLWAKFGADGNDAAVTRINTMNALTDGLTKVGIYYVDANGNAITDSSKWNTANGLYINASMINSGALQVADSSGNVKFYADVDSGNITLGNFNVSAVKNGVGSISSGKTSLTSTSAGVYLGTDGIAIGNGGTNEQGFRVGKDGTAIFTGTITAKGFTIDDTVALNAGLSTTEYADQAEKDAVDAAAKDATNKANTAENNAINAAQGLANTAYTNAVAEAQKKASAAQAAATAEAQAFANAAQAAAIAAAEEKDKAVANAASAANAAATNAQTDATKANTQISNWGTGSTTIVGGATISQPIYASHLKADIIKSSNCNSVNQTTGYTDNGTYFDLTTGALNSKNFCITSGGDAKFKGYVEATSGKIGDLVLSGGALYTTGKTSASSSNNGVYISASQIKLGGNFEVSQTGHMTAKAGKIGGWFLGNNILASVSTNSNNWETTLTSGGIILDPSHGIKLGTNFLVDTQGNVTANNGTFTGEITATKLTIAANASVSGVATTSQLNSVKQTADTAASTASAASTTANTAKTTAEGAVSTANTAASTANTAKTTADTAASTANTAKSTANTAVSTANTAKATAEGAVSTANGAKATADGAASTANAANTILNDWTYSENDSITMSGGSINAGNINCSKIAVKYIKGVNCKEVVNGGYTSGGMLINLDQAGSIHAQNFYIGQDGSAHFKGAIESGSTIKGAEFNNGTGTFKVTSAGYLTAKSGKIAGLTINSDLGLMVGERYNFSEYPDEEGSGVGMLITPDRDEDGSNIPGICFGSHSGSSAYEQFLTAGLHQIAGQPGAAKQYYATRLMMDGVKTSYSNKDWIGLDDFSVSGGFKQKTDHIEMIGTWKSGSTTVVTSDARLKNSIVPLSDDYETIFDNLEPVSYKYNDGTSGRIHIGFIAQSTNEARALTSITQDEFAPLCLVNRGQPDEHWTMRYEEFIALNTDQIQKAKKRISQLETENLYLKSRLDVLESKIQAMI